MDDTQRHTRSSGMTEGSEVSKWVEQEIPNSITLFWSIREPFITATCNINHASFNFGGWKLPLLIFFYLFWTYCDIYDFPVSSL